MPAMRFLEIVLLVDNVPEQIGVRWALKGTGAGVGGRDARGHAA